MVQGEVWDGGSGSGLALGCLLGPDHPAGLAPGPARLAALWGPAYPRLVILPVVDYVALAVPVQPAGALQVIDELGRLVSPVGGHGNVGRVPPYQAAIWLVGGHSYPEAHQVVHRSRSHRAH